MLKIRRFKIETSCQECSKVFETTTTKTIYCSKSCGHRAQYRNRMLDYEWRLGKLLAMAKNRAKTKQLPFDLDMDHLVSLWEENRGCCEISGIEMELGRSDKGKTHPYAPSLDRITPSLGYTKGNVRIICYQMNIALSEFGLDQFEEFIRLYILNSGVSYRS